MGIKSNIFSSKAEKKNYDKLKRNWGKDYFLYHNIPFLNILTLDDLVDFSDWKNPTPVSLSQDETEALKHASIDYVLCDLKNRPIIAVEFDGLQDGFSSGSKYYPERLSKHLRPWRREKLELKLRVSNGSQFPLFVVGSRFFKDITPHLNMTIVDGIIGSVITSSATQIMISEGFKPENIGYSQDEFDILSPSAQHDIIQDWVIGVEVDAELEYNPLSRKRAQEEDRLNVTSFRTEYLNYPEIPKGITMSKRVNLFSGIILQGATVTLLTKDFGEIEGTAWVPNLKMVKYSPLGLAEDIAALIALDKLRIVMGYSPYR
jgi:hypothetical protein